MYTREGLEVGVDQRVAAVGNAVLLHFLDPVDWRTFNRIHCIRYAEDKYTFVATHGNSESW